MIIRLAIAIAAEGESDVLLVDEGIGFGDDTFKARVRARFQDMSSQSRVLVVASHSADLLRAFCNKGLFLRNGEIVSCGSLEETIEAYEAWVADAPDDRRSLKTAA